MHTHIHENMRVFYVYTAYETICVEIECWHARTSMMMMNHQHVCVQCAAALAEAANHL